MKRGILMQTGKPTKIKHDLNFQLEWSWPLKNNDQVERQEKRLKQEDPVPRSLHYVPRSSS